MCNDPNEKRGSLYKLFRENTDMTPSMVSQYSLGVLSGNYVIQELPIDCRQCGHFQYPDNLKKKTKYGCIQRKCGHCKDRRMQSKLRIVYKPFNNDEFHQMHYYELTCPLVSLDALKKNLKVIEYDCSDTPCNDEETHMYDFLRLLFKHPTIICNILFYFKTFKEGLNGYNSSFEMLYKYFDIVSEDMIEDIKKELNK